MDFARSWPHVASGLLLEMGVGTNIHALEYAIILRCVVKSLAILSHRIENWFDGGFRHLMDLIPLDERDEFAGLRYLSQKTVMQGPT